MYETRSGASQIKTASLLLFSRSVMPDSLQPHGLQHTRLPCLSLSPEVCSSSCPLSHDASSHLILCDLLQRRQYLFISAEFIVIAT